MPRKKIGFGKQHFFPGLRHPHWPRWCCWCWRRAILGPGSKVSHEAQLLVGPVIHLGFSHLEW